MQVFRTWHFLDNINFRLINFIPRCLTTYSRNLPEVTLNVHLRGLFSNDISLGDQRQDLDVLSDHVTFWTSL